MKTQYIKAATFQTIKVPVIKEDLDINEINTLFDINSINVEITNFNNDEDVLDLSVK